MEAKVKVIQIEEKGYRMELCNDPLNKRIRVEYILGNAQEALQKAELITFENKAEKLIILGRAEQYRILLEQGFQPEGLIDHFFNGTHCYYFSKFYSINRKQSEHWLVEDGIIKNVNKLEPSSSKIHPPIDYIIQKMTKQDAEALSSLYQKVFKVYPTPLQDPSYIKKTIDEGTIYFGFYKDDKVVSAASAEINNKFKNAELTDCATLPDHRKHGLLKILLLRLEQELMEKGIYCAFSIARALSFGMNAALFQLGYRYRGRLMNNCYIYDKLEDMNVWVKDLSSVPNIEQRK